MEENWEFDKPLHLSSNDFLTRVSKLFNRGRILFSTNGVGTIDNHMQSNEVRFHSMWKLNSKWISDISVNQRYKALRKKVGVHFCDLGLGRIS